MLRPRALLAGGAACAAAFIALLFVAYLSAEARAVDGAALEGFVGLQGPTVDRIAGQVVNIGDPGPVILAALALAGIALLRDRPRSALFAFALIAITSIGSQLLKALLAYPRAEGQIEGAAIGEAAFPSGHTTATMSVAIAFVVVAPPRLRGPAAVIGLVTVVAMSYSLVAGGGHFPSDVLGGYLLATGTALFLLAGLRLAESRYPERSGRSASHQVARRTADRVIALGLVATLMATVLVLLAVVAGVLIFRLPDVVDYAQAHTAFFVVASVLAVSALVLISGLFLAIGRRS